MTAKTTNTLIVGAGDAGRVVAKELLNTDLLPFRPVAFPTFMTAQTAAPAPKKSFCGKKKEKVAT